MKKINMFSICELGVSIAVFVKLVVDSTNQFTFLLNIVYILGLISFSSIWILTGIIAYILNSFAGHYPVEEMRKELKNAKPKPFIEFLMMIPDLIIVASFGYVNIFAGIVILLTITLIWYFFNRGVDMETEQKNIDI